MLCNYNNFKYFITTKSLFICQAQYIKELAKFNFKIKYKLGKVNPINTLFQYLDYAKGFKNSSKRIVLNAILPILQQKLQVIGLIGGLSITTLNQQVVYMQYISDPRKYSISRPKYSAILFKTFLIGLIISNLKKDPSA